MCNSLNPVAVHTDHLKGIKSLPVEGSDCRLAELVVPLGTDAAWQCLWRARRAQDAHKLRSGDVALPMLGVCVFSERYSLSRYAFDRQPHGVVGSTEARSEHLLSFCDHSCA